MKTIKSLKHKIIRNLETYRFNNDVQDVESEVSDNQENLIDWKIDEILEKEIIK